MSSTELRIDPTDWLPTHGDVLYRHALRALNCRELAEDFVQDTLLQGIRSLPGFQGRSSVRSWLLTILRNRIIDHYRKRGRQATASPADGPERVDPVDTPERLLEEMDTRQQLQACIDELPEPMREMFELSEVEGLRHSELIERFQLTLGNVRVRMHRARLQVRDCLTKKGVNL